MTKFIVIEGTIGAGKSVLLNVLAEEYISRGFKVCAVPEPVDEWRESGALSAFYANPTAFAYSFQTYVFMTRIQRVKNYMKDKPDADIVIIERSPASDNLFWGLQSSTECEKTMYNTWCRGWLELLPFRLEDAKVIYLRTSLEHCMDRMNSRNRLEEIASGERLDIDTPQSSAPLAKGGVSREYQKALIIAHDKFLLGGGSPYQSDNIIVIDSILADLDFRSTNRREVTDYIFEMLNIE